MKIIHKDELKSSDSLKKEDIVARLIKNRGITEVETFLHPPSPLEMTLADFGFGPEIPHMMKILEKIKKSGRTIVVYTDYDADGITGGAILWETLHLLGFKALPYVPHRKLEGYGFSITGIDRIKKEHDPALIMSVDHGITAVSQIEYARSIGIPVIVTDHHHKQEKIPTAAEAIFHIPALSGSGVAYMVAKEIFEHFKDSARHADRLQKNFETDYLSLASIGTIADLVPLVGPSRSIASYGLQAFSQVTRPGIVQIRREAKIMDKEVSPYEVGFVIAPRINAVGRLEHAIDALRLLCTTSDKRAFDLASKVGELNINRRTLVKQNVEEALLQVEAMQAGGKMPKIIILHSKDWHEGVIGLIASNILQKYYRPVIVMTEGEGLMKGSARSIVGFHITHFFEELSEYFINFGGHAAAGGFSLPVEKLEAFMLKAVDVASAQITDADLEQVIEVDLKAPISAMSIQLARDVESLQPFGIGNAQPSFVSEAEVISAALFGKKNDHLKMTIKDMADSSFPLEMIGFGMADRFEELSRGQKIQVAYQLDINRWNGRETLRGRIMNILTI